MFILTPSVFSLSVSSVAAASDNQFFRPPPTGTRLVDPIKGAVPGTTKLAGPPPSCPCNDDLNVSDNPSARGIFSYLYKHI